LPKIGLSLMNFSLIFFCDFSIFRCARALDALRDPNRVLVIATCPHGHLNYQQPDSPAPSDLGSRVEDGLTVCATR
jgi:hypothetical protein